MTQGNRVYRVQRNATHTQQQHTLPSPCHPAPIPTIISHGGFPFPASRASCLVCLRLISAKTEFDAGDVKQLIYALYDVVLDTPHDLEVQVRGGGACCFPVVRGWGQRGYRETTQSSVVAAASIVTPTPPPPPPPPGRSSGGGVGVAAEVTAVCTTTMQQ